MRLRFEFSLLLGCVVALLTFSISPALSNSPQTSRYIGNDKCLSCHKDYRRYFGTAHHLTSQTATVETIAGSFAFGKNILKTSHELHYRLEAKQGGFFQTGLLGSPPAAISISERFDIVIGSGRKGQTYLYWGKEDQLFQLPVSYWTPGV